MFNKYQTKALVYTQGTVIEWWYKKSWYINSWKIYTWHLKAQSINKIIDLWMFWKVYVFHTDIWANIKEWDRLIINNINYDVKGVSEFDWITFKTKQILLNRI